MRAIVSSLAILACAMPLAAADIDEDLQLARDLDYEPYVNLRLGYGFAPVPTTYHYTYEPIVPGPATDQIDHYSTDTLPAYSLGLIGGSNAPVGWVLGIEGVLVNGKQRFRDTVVNGAVTPRNPGTPDSLYRSYGANVLAGIECNFRQRYRLELLGFAGGGRVRLNQLTFALDQNQEGSGWYSTMGVRAGLYATIRRFVVGMCVDYATSEIHDVTVAWLGGNSYYFPTTWSGLGGRIELGYRLQ